MFGVTYKTLLTADQKQKIVSITNIIATVLATILAAILLKLNYSIITVKFGSTIMFALQPLVLGTYAKKQYKIDKNVAPDTDAISQRWDSFALQVANFVHLNTDVVILTIFCPLEEVSVYSVYIMVANAVKQIITNVAGSFEAAIGNMMAKNQGKSLRDGYDMIQIIIFFLGGIAYTCMAVLIIPFVLIYTKGITDISYNRVLFAIFLSLAELIGCFRIPYDIVIQAAGHYKQTKNVAIIEAIINIVLSIFLVRKYGIIGVTVGTIVAMLFRTVMYARYCSKNLIKNDKKIYYFKRGIEIGGGTFAAAWLSTRVDYSVNNYVEWVGLAIVRALIVMIVFIAVFGIFERKILSKIFANLKGVISNGRKSSEE